MNPARLGPVSEGVIRCLKYRLNITQLCCPVLRPHGAQKHGISLARKQPPKHQERLTREVSTRCKSSSSRLPATARITRLKGHGQDPFLTASHKCVVLCSFTKNFHRYCIYYFIEDNSIILEPVRKSMTERYKSL